ncbi:MAG: hypothetical protein HRT61_12715 [Ekhidna sp.]|nr:hypothetical protein [Ekhidna sp.]
MRPHRSLYLLICLLFTINAHAQVSDAEFRKILSAAISGVKLTHSELNYFERYDPVFSKREIAESTWELGVQHWIPNTTSAYYVGLQKGKAIVKNMGDHYEFYATSQPVVPILVEDVANGKWIKKGENWTFKEAKVSDISYGFGENFLTVSGSGNYSDGIDKITKDLSLLIQMARGRLHAIAFDEKKIREKTLGEFNKNGVTEMPKGWLPFVVEDNALAKFAKENKNAPNGNWIYSDNNKNIDFYVYNYDKELVYFVTRTVDEGFAKENNEKLLSAMKAFVDKNPVKGASSTEAVLDKDTFYGVKITIKYDGSVKGSVFSKIYWELWNNYKNKLAKTIDSNV